MSESERRQRSMGEGKRLNAVTFNVKSVYVPEHGPWHTNFSKSDEPYFPYGYYYNEINGLEFDENGSAREIPDWFDECEALGEGSSEQQDFFKKKLRDYQKLKSEFESRKGRYPQPTQEAIENALDRCNPLGVAEAFIELGQPVDEWLLQADFGVKALLEYNNLSKGRVEDVSDDNDLPWGQGSLEFMLADEDEPAPVKPQRSYFQQLTPRELLEMREAAIARKDSEGNPYRSKFAREVLWKAVLADITKEAKDGIRKIIQADQKSNQSKG